MKNVFSTHRVVAATAMAFLFVASFSIRAATINWTNAASGGWGTAANWNPNSVPSTNDTAIITNAGVTVSLNGATTIGAIILGTNGAGMVMLSLAGWTLALNGPLTVNPSGSFTVDSGALVGNTNAVLSGTIGWSAANLGGNLTLASGSTLNITTGNNHFIGGCIFTNSGTVNWSGSQLLAGGGAAFYNYGLWNAQDDQQLNNYSGGAGTVFNNFGTFRKSGGASEFATATVFPSGVVFNQLAGVIDVQNGTNGLQLSFQGGGNFTGGYITTNQFGLTLLAGGNFNLNGTVTGTNTWETGNLVGTNVINGALTWQSGSWANTMVTLPSNSTLNITTGNNHFIGGCIFTNSGTVNWSDGQLLAGGGAVFYNYGLWNAQDDQNLLNYSGDPGTVFNNFGTFRKSGGTTPSYTLIGNPVSFNNTGVVDVQHGVLVLQGNDNFTGGYITTNSTGITYFSSGNFNLNGTATGTNVIESAGNLVGTNVINGALSWQDGSWANTVVTVTTNSVLNIPTANNHFIGGCIFTNSGTVNWSDGQLLAGGGAAFYNYGLWNAQDDQNFLNYSGDPGTVFNNFGTFRKELTSGTTTIFSGVTFNNSGKLDAQDGNIALQGAYTLANGTKMSFGLGGPAGNGSISLSGAASFTGSLSANLNGFFWPGVGSSFNLLNYTSESGLLFTNTTLPAPGYITWQTNYNATAFALSVVAHTATNTVSTNLHVSALNGSNILLQWPGDHTGWTIQAQTNPVTVGLSINWATLPGSSLTNQIVMPIDKTNGSVFFRMIYP